MLIEPKLSENIRNTVPINHFTVTASDQDIPVVNARELHTFLLSKQHFSDWIQDRIQQYNFIENQDYVLDTTKAMNQTGRGGYNAKDYLLTITAALLIVAKERGPARDQLLDYFIVNTGELSALWQAVLDFEIPEDVPATMYVYAIKNQLTGNIKLGISKNPEARLKQLQTGNDGQLVLVAYKVAHNRFSDEKLAHQDNQGVHVRREWFGPSAKLDGATPYNIVALTKPQHIVKNNLYFLNPHPKTFQRKCLNS